MKNGGQGSKYTYLEVHAVSFSWEILFHTCFPFFGIKSLSPPGIGTFFLFSFIALCIDLMMISAIPYQREPDGSRLNANLF